MKKLYSFITLAMMAFSSQAAIQVTYNGQALTDGQQIALGKDSFTETVIIPGVMSIFKAEAALTVNGATPIQVKAESPSQTFQYCTGSNCFSLAPQGDIYAHETTITNVPETLNVDINSSAASLPSDIKSEISFVLTDKTGSSISFKVSVDSSSNAGIENVASDSEYVRLSGRQLVYSLNAPTAVVVYSIAGNAVLSTTVDGSGEVSLHALHQGIYIYRAGSFTGKILIK